MTKNNDKQPSIEGLDLEPLGDENHDSESDNKAQFHIDTRSGSDRRQLSDRRKEIRFQSDRRQGKGRRKDDNTWESNN